MASSASHCANCFSLSLGNDARPCDRSARGPPSSHVRRHRYTERTLTRRSLAITELASPSGDTAADGQPSGQEDLSVGLSDAAVRRARRKGASVGTSDADLLVADAGPVGVAA
ncbi:hypothetical protein GCM10010313_06230 [Streptomyces violarus]|nr:hypothetical protein GCM10010313_06230 [Streptomyces violarus]